MLHGENGSHLFIVIPTHEHVKWSHLRMLLYNRHVFCVDRYFNDTIGIGAFGVSSRNEIVSSKPQNSDDKAGYDFRINCFFLVEHTG